MRYAVTFSWWLALTMFILALPPVSVSSAYGFGIVTHASVGEYIGVPNECVDEYVTYALAESPYQMALRNSAFGIPDFAAIAAVKEDRDEAWTNGLLRIYGTVSGPTMSQSYSGFE